MADVTVASFVISIVALVAAGASAWFTRTQAQAAHEIAFIDRARAHDEREPKYALSVRPLNPGQPVYYQLRARLISAGPVSISAIELLEPESGVKFTPGIEGVDPSTPSPVRAGSHPEPVAVGDEAVWQLEVDDEADRDLTVRVTSMIGAEIWVSVERVSVPVGQSRA